MRVLLLGSASWPRLAGPRFALSLLLVASGPISLGCAAKVRVPAYRVQTAPAPPHFVAGASRRDITPPAGFPMGGYSVGGRVSRGHWMRLYVRAFYFRDATGRALAVASCDLFAIPRGLHAKVAHALSPRGIGPDSLILAATHTHQSPGNYMSSALYNGFASPLPGFHEDLLQFLSLRISEAIGEAMDRSLAAGPANLVLKSGRIDGLVRNRSPESFLLNRDRDEVIREGPPAPPDCPGDCPRYRAVDPAVRVLEVHHQTGSQSRATAALVFFAIHPTAMSNHFGFYNPDLTGRAMRQVETTSHVAGFVAGFFNGAEGDVSPRWHRRDANEVRELAALLSEGVQRLLGQPVGARHSDPRIRGRLRSVSQKDFCDGTEPMFGVAVVGGAVDGRSAFYNLGWRQGPNAIRTNRPIKGQGRKQPALDSKWLPGLKITDLLSPPRHFPREVPVSVAELGPLVLAALPVEMTTTIGRRLRAGLSALYPQREVVLVGLANEYLSYVTTPEEYDFQDYEGGSTIFGPSEGDCFSSLLRTAAGDLGRPPDPEVPALTLPAGNEPTSLLGPERWNGNQPWWTPGLARLLERSSSVRAEDWPRFEWIAARSGMRDAVDQRVAILEQDGAGWRVAETEDDSNLILVLRNGGPPSTWSASWMPPAGVGLEALHILEVKRADGSRRCSVPFSVHGIQDGRIDLPLRSMDCPAVGGAP